MKNFIHDHFLLQNKTAEMLYHDFVSQLPIIDYHNHLPPQAIAENKQFENITALWLEGDHYKWRAMRTLGVNEKFITGNASDAEKFSAFAAATPSMICNPLYHWTHLELARYFNHFELLSEKNAQAVYEHTTHLVQQPEYSTQNLLTRMQVESLCTTEDPIDSLVYHQQIAASDFSVKVSTAFRPDKSVLIDAPNYNDYLDQLAEVAQQEINSYDALCEALLKRMQFFHDKGCRLSDHGLNYIPFRTASAQEINSIFAKRRKGANLSLEESEQFQTALLVFLGKAYHQKGWVQQYHLGAMRNNNKRMFHKLGPDTGWDSIGTYPITETLSRFLDELDQNDQLAKTILYNLNPADNAMMASMIGNFNDGSTIGKVQWGSGWWFLDQLDGMTEQMKTLSNMGIISCFVGMLTDSRSFLSYPRHEYFRRLVCHLFGTDMENGLLPNDPEWIGKIAADICYHNAKNYFSF